MVYMFSNDWAENQKKNNISWHLKIYEIQISVSINKMLLEHSHIHSFMIWSGTAFLAELKSWDRDSIACKILGYFIA